MAQDLEQNQENLPEETGKSESKRGLLFWIGLAVGSFILVFVTILLLLVYVGDPLEDGEGDISGVDPDSSAVLVRADSTQRNAGDMSDSAGTADLDTTAESAGEMRDNPAQSNGPETTVNTAQNIRTDDVSAQTEEQAENSEPQPAEPISTSRPAEPATQDNRQQTEATLSPSMADRDDQPEDRESQVDYGQLAKIYSQMDAGAAAEILTELEDEMVVGILREMRDRNAAELLMVLDSRRAARLSRKLSEGEQES